MEKIAYLAIKNHALGKGALPRLLTYLRFGDNPTDRGVFKVTQRTVDAIAAQREGGLHDRPLIDFEHNSLEESPTYQPPPRHHAGVGTVFCSPERGLGQEDVEWTPKGEEYARNYPDVSPALKYDTTTMEVTGLVSSGLVPAGGVIGLSFFNALQTAPSSGAKPNEENDMDGLKEQIAALEAQLKDLRAKLEAMKDSTPKNEEVEGLSAKTKAIGDQVAAMSADMKAEFARRDKDALLQQAVFAGKVVSLTDDAVAALSVKDLKAHIDALEVTVPLARRTPTGAKPEQEGTSLVAQFNALTDPAEKAEFYTKNRKALVGR